LSIDSILFVMAVHMEEHMNFVFHAGNIFWDKRDITKQLSNMKKGTKWRLLG